MMSHNTSVNSHHSPTVFKNDDASQWWFQGRDLGLGLYF